MLVQEKFKLKDDGWTLVKTYSDAGMMVEQVGTGARYAEAIDPEHMHREYIETDEPIEKEEKNPLDDFFDELNGEDRGDEENQEEEDTQEDAEE